MDDDSTPADGTSGRGGSGDGASGDGTSDGGTSGHGAAGPGTPDDGPSDDDRSDSGPSVGAAVRVLTLCTANQCRSPMAEVLLRRALAARGVDADVRSAGSMRGGVRASPGSVRAMARRGLVLDAHLSHQQTPADVSDADLVLCMARSHARAAVVAHPAAWSRTFTLKELVRRGESVGARRPGQALADWLAVLGGGRQRASLLAEDLSDDVADPMGQPDPAYEATAAQLEDLVERAVVLAFPDGVTTAAG